MFTSLPFAIPKKVMFIFILLTFLVIGCRGQSNPTAVNTAVSSSRFTYQIRVLENVTNQPVETANVTIDLPGAPPVNDFTDSTGLAVFLIDSQFADKIVLVHVTKNGYQDWDQTITLKTGERPQVMKLQLEQSDIAMVITETPTAVSSTNTPQPPPTQEQATNTAVPPTNTPQPTATATDTQTPTTTATATTTSATTTPNEIIAQATNGDTWLYAGPGDGNARLGSMKVNDTGIVLGKDKWDGWYKLRLNTNREGWVDKNDLKIIQGSPNDITVIWPAAEANSGNNDPGTTTELPSGGRSSSECATVTLTFKQWPNETFDDISVSWSNIPPNTAYFIFAANGTLNGEEAPLIYPTQVNPNEEYFIGLWKFAERGFTSGGTFSYALQAKTSNGTSICTTTGTFTQ